MLGAIGLMFFLFETGFSLSTPGFIQNEVMDLMDFIKMLFFLAGFAAGFLVIGLMNAIVSENVGSVGLVSFVSMFYWFWGVFFMLTVFGFAIYYLWWIPKKMQEALKRSKNADEGL